MHDTKLILYFAMAIFLTALSLWSIPDLVRVLFKGQPWKVKKTVYFGVKAKLMVLLSAITTIVFAVLFVYWAIKYAIHPESMPDGFVSPRFITLTHEQLRNVSLASIIVGCAWMIGVCSLVKILPKSYRVIFKNDTIEWIDGPISGRNAKLIVIVGNVVYLCILVFLFYSIPKLNNH